MNYFTTLLLAAGLPVTIIHAQPRVSYRAPIGTTVSPWTVVETVEQAYQTIALSASATGTSWVEPLSAAAPSSATSVGPSSSAPVVTPTPVVPSGATGSAPATSGTASNAAPGRSTPTATANTAEAMITLINQAREHAGLPPYTVNPQLMALAQERAVALADGPFTSDLPGYGWPVQMEQAAGIQAQGMGAENIAEANSVSQAFALLMASLPHRSNILNPNETQIGVGVAPWGSGVAISELFIGPST